MARKLIALIVAAALAAAPCSAAELFDEAAAAPVLSGAVAGAYFQLPLDRPAASTPSPRAGLRLAMSHSTRSPRAFASTRESNLLDLRLADTSRPSFLVAGRALGGANANRLAAAEGESKGRLDKIMIGAGVALGVVAGFFLVSSVAD